MGNVVGNFREYSRESIFILLGHITPRKRGHPFGECPRKLGEVAEWPKAVVL